MELIKNKNKKTRPNSYNQNKDTKPEIKERHKPF